VAVWVSKGGEFPSLYRGFLVQRGAGPTVTLMLTECEKYTWVNYHGKLTSKPLWEQTTDQTFYEASLAPQQEEGKQRWVSGNLTLTVEQVTETVAP
jgi:hypothetical protein